MFSPDRVRAKPSRSALTSWFIVPDTQRHTCNTHFLHPSVLQPLSFPFCLLFSDHTPCIHTHANRHTKTRGPYNPKQMFCIKKQQGSLSWKPQPNSTVRLVALLYSCLFTSLVPSDSLCLYWNTTASLKVQLYSFSHSFVAATCHKAAVTDVYCGAQKWSYRWSTWSVSRCKPWHVCVTNWELIDQHQVHLHVVCSLCYRCFWCNVLLPERRSVLFRPSVWWRWCRECL